MSMVNPVVGDEAGLNSSLATTYTFVFVLMSRHSNHESRRTGHLAEARHASLISFHQCMIQKNDAGGLVCAGAARPC